MSVRIANARGVPGTLGCLARTVHQQRAVFLTSAHVMFAAGATRDEPVWRVHEADGHRDFRRLGSALLGKRGIVRWRGDDYFVDCAIGALDAPPGEPSRDAASFAREAALPKQGDLVSKTGAATGTTLGVVVDTSYTANSANPRDAAPGQLLIRSTDPARPFAGDGDSGALLVNDAGIPIGLLWGSTVSADSVACPIGPVLHALNIRLCGAAQ